MEEIKIHLNFNVEDFREIYYNNGTGKILTNKPFRNAIFLPFLLVIVTIVIYFLSQSLPSISWLLILSCLAVLGSIIYAIVCLVKFLKWKRATENYLQSISGFKSYIVNASEKAIEVSFDSETTIERWDQITSVYFGNEYIGIHKEGRTVFMFPSKSMMPDEYEKLKQFIREKMK